MKPWMLAVILSLLASNAWAGIYIPGEKPSFLVDEDGTAKALPYDAFNFLLATARNRMVDDPKAGPDSDRARILQQIRKLQQKLPETSVALTAREIQAGQFDPAMNLLRDPLFQRSEPFFAYSHLAWANFLTGGYADARTSQAAAKSFFPKRIDSYTDAQLKWYRRLEREYLINLFHSRVLTPKSRDVDPIFGEPIQFTDADGIYRPGSIPKSEKAKLPPDAIAIVQQLVLWAPTDARLYWLLGELYNADGQIEPAKSILDSCVQSLNYQTEVLRVHRRAVAEEVEKRQAEAKKPQVGTNASPDSRAWLPSGPTLWIVLGGAGLVVLALVVWQIRVIVRQFSHG